MASPLASEQLLARLRDENENPMVRLQLNDDATVDRVIIILKVRHECAEALGDIPGVEMEAEMAKYLDPKIDPVVRESCEVGLLGNVKEMSFCNKICSPNKDKRGTC